MRKVLLYFQFIFIYTLSQSVSAQVGSADTSFRSIAVQGLISLFHKNTNINSELYNGTTYESYFPIFKSSDHPFFKNNDFQNGSVQISGVAYENLPLMYDLIRGSLVLKHQNGVSWLALVSQKIDWFTLHGYKFIRVDKNNSLGLAEGFYNLLFAGKVSLMSKHEKTKRDIIEDRRILSAVSEKTSFYIIKDGKAHQIKNKKALLALLGDKRSSLNQYIRQNRLNFKKETERALIQTTSYYDQLTHS